MNYLQICLFQLQGIGESLSEFIGDTLHSLGQYIVPKLLPSQFHHYDTWVTASWGWCFGFYFNRGGYFDARLAFDMDLIFFNIHIKLPYRSNAKKFDGVYQDEGCNVAEYGFNVSFSERCIFVRYGTDEHGDNYSIIHLPFCSYVYSHDAWTYRFSAPNVSGTIVAFRTTPKRLRWTPITHHLVSIATPHEHDRVLLFKGGYAQVGRNVKFQKWLDTHLTGDSRVTLFK